jgi:hypothetical protein
MFQDISLQPHEDAVLNTSSERVEGLNYCMKRMVTNVIGVDVIRCSIFIGLEGQSILLTVVNSLYKYYVGQCPLRYRYFMYTFQELALLPFSFGGCHYADRLFVPFLF